MASHSKSKGLQHLIKACFYSYEGVKAAYKSESAFRQDVFICSILFLISLFVPISQFESLFLYISLFNILISELINTAIETIIDRISSEYHGLSKKAKDIGSAIVCLSFIQLIVVLLFIIYNLIF